MSIYERLLRQWCEKLLELQIDDIDNAGIHGGIMCPACARIHGRCFDAIYPFMYLADKDKDMRYLEGAKKLFDWAMQVVSREDGSFVNDTNSDWKGTTVFTVIQLVEALKYHGHLLDEITYEKWKNRIAKAADFLYHFESLNQNNVNYKITNSLAMQYCGELLGIEAYTSKAKELAYTAIEHISESGILFGEGRPIKGYSPRGCRPVDIGYNMEESLPSLVLYGYLMQDEVILLVAKKALAYQLKFMLEDGGLDNSFGTRNFKWTYWGSRTSDGCAMGYLLLAHENPAFGVAALKNTQLLEACTHEGLLHGGPHYKAIGERACVHHTFAHSKVFAAILDHNLDKENYEGELPRHNLRGIEYFKDIDTYQIGCESYTATVTGYDWEYLKGGHTSGGALSMLWHKKAGVILCASMSEYSMKEPNNMQLPRFNGHECLTPRIVYEEEGCVYSNIYDYKSELTTSLRDDTRCIGVQGKLNDIDHNKPQGDKGNYTIEYIFAHQGISVQIELDQEATYILPLIGENSEKIEVIEKGISLEKEGVEVVLTIEEGEVADTKELIYNLVPGFTARKVILKPHKGRIVYHLEFKECK